MTKRTSRSASELRLISKVAGLPYRTLALIYIGLIVGFGIVYALLATYVPSHGPSLPQAHPLLRMFEGLYFSTVTATTVGYGDIVPHGFSKILAGLQSISSLFVFAILVSKPISERQEAALYQMHQLTFDDVFTSIREGFFIMRRDFDGLMSEARSTRALRPHAWENLTTAYRQGEVLLEEIPKFYDTKQQLYVIDDHREELLLEAVERTLDRLMSMLKTFDASGIAWRSEQKSAGRFAEFLTLAEDTVDNWQTWSPHPASEDFVCLQTKIADIKVLGDR